MQFDPSATFYINLLFILAFIFQNVWQNLNYAAL